MGERQEKSARSRTRWPLNASYARCGHLTMARLMGTDALHKFDPRVPKIYNEDEMLLVWQASQAVTKFY
jgi:hypothetical protein